MDGQAIIKLEYGIHCDLTPYLVHCMRNERGIETTNVKCLRDRNAKHEIAHRAVKQGPLNLYIALKLV